MTALTGSPQIWISGCIFGQCVSGRIFLNAGLWRSEQPRQKQCRPTQINSKATQDQAKPLQTRAHDPISVCSLDYGVRLESRILTLLTSLSLFARLLLENGVLNLHLLTPLSLFTRLRIENGVLNLGFFNSSQLIR